MVAELARDDGQTDKAERSYRALLAGILFAAMYVVWNYYPHPQIALPVVTAYSTPSGG